MSMPKNLARRALASSTILMLVGGVAACSKDKHPTGPVAGALSLALTTPNFSDGAVMLAIAGGPVDSVTGAGSFRVFGGAGPSTSGAARRVIVRGDLAADATIARVWVPDVAAVGSYRVTVEQAAARTSYQQRAVLGYAITVTR